MARSFKCNPFTKRKEKEQYLRRERRYSARKKGIPNPEARLLQKIWDEGETRQEKSAREWQQLLEREVYGYY